MRLSPEELYAVARAAGFPPSTARKMVAIALKESGGDPRATNLRAPDESYGLWQINLYGRLRGRLAQYSLSSPSDLFNPAVNARIAYDLWAGNDANLERHWGILSGPGAGAYARYLAALPSFGESAGPSYGGGGGGETSGPAGWSLPALPAALSDVNPWHLAAAAGAALAVWSLLSLLTSDDEAF